MTKMESEIVFPQKPLFHRRYIDYIYSGKKTFKNDELFERLNNYHPKIKLTIEVSPKKCLGTCLHLNNGIFEFKVYRKTAKQSIHWSSKIPKRYKHNMILGGLPESNCVYSNFSEE